LPFFTSLFWIFVLGLSRVGEPLHTLWKGHRRSALLAIASVVFDDMEDTAATLRTSTSRRKNNEGVGRHLFSFF